MKHLLSLFLFCLFSISVCAQISTIDFVGVIDGNRSETIYYYENNWKVLREMAIKKKYIDSYQFLEVEPTPEAPFSFLLITTYKDEEQYAAREKNFRELIEQKGENKLLNDKKPAEFRKILFSKETIH